MNGKQITEKMEAKLFSKQLHAIEGLTDQTAVHRKKFEYALNQLRKFTRNFTHRASNAVLSNERLEAAGAVLVLFQELSAVLGTFLLQTWTSPTIENPSDSVLSSLKSIFSRIKEKLATLDEGSSQYIDAISSKWDQYHVLDLRAIRASFGEYIKESHEDQQLTKSIMKRLESIDRHIAASTDVADAMRTFSPIPVNYRNWRVSIDDFCLKKPVGSGVTATVFYAIDKRTGNEVAVKEFNTLKMNGNKLQSFQREIACLANAVHPTVLGLIGATDSQPFCIITEWMPNGSLYHDLHYTKRLDATGKSIAAFDIARGMQYLHSMQIVHRDLKSLNILLDSNCRIRICDFGFSRHADSESQMTSGIGTPHWMAPEILKGRKNYTAKVDVYAYAIVLWELATSQTPYFGQDTKYIINEVITKDVRPLLPNDINPAWKDLITQCWDTDPDNRPSFDEIVRKFEEEKIRIDGTDEEIFQKYMKDCLTTHEAISKTVIEIISQALKGTISLRLAVKKIKKIGGLPVDIINQLWKPELIKDHISDDAAEYLLLFLKTSKLSEVAKLLRNMPKRSIPKSVIYEFISEVPTGSEEIDTDLIISSCKNGVPDLAAIYAAKSSDLTLALYSCSYLGVDLKLRAAVIDRCIQNLNMQNNGSNAAALQCLVGIGELKKIPMKIIAHYLKSNNNELINSALLALFTLINNNLFEDSPLNDEIINVLFILLNQNETIQDHKDIQKSALASIISICMKNQDLSQKILDKLNENINNVKNLNENTLKILITIARYQTLREEIKQIIQNSIYHDSINESVQKLLCLL